MPIVYRDVRTPRPTAFRLPPGFPPGHACMRTESDEGDFVGVWDPIVFSVANIPKDAVWHDLVSPDVAPPGRPNRAAPDGDWKVCQVGEIDPRTLLRHDAGRPALIPVADSLGRTWHAPAVLSPKGECVLSMSLGRNELGQWTRNPSPEQAAIIAAATFARQEIPRLNKEAMPLSAAADTAATLLTSVYLLSVATFAQLGMADDRLVLQVMMASAGFLPEG